MSAGPDDTPARPAASYAIAEPTRRDGARALSPLAVLLVSLLFTAAATAFVAYIGRARDHARFENAAQVTRDRIAQRLETYVALLYGAAGLFAASDSVGADEFHRYVTRLEVARRYPGVQGIGFSRRLPPPSDPRQAAALRAGGSLATRVWPDAPRDAWHAIVYLEPLDARNRAALGFDMHADPVRREAMDRARDTGRAAASGPVTLVQEITSRKQRGFLLYVPVYRGALVPPTVAARREALEGFAYAAFRVDDLFGGIFGSEHEPRVTFRVFDGRDTTAAALLVDSRALPGARAPAPQRLPRLAREWTTAEIDVGGRRWTIALADLPARDTIASELLVVVIALVGTLVSGALFLVTRAEARARTRAERSEAARTRFFAAMSHELRTPINAILGYLDLLLAGVHGPVPPAQAGALERAQRASRHLLELVNDVLDVSKLEAGKIDVVPEDVRLDALLDDLLVTIRPMAEARGSPVVVDVAPCDVTLRTDPRRLRQILLNLLSNATRFGGGRPVRVRCTRQGRTLAIAVRDEGPGIAPADQERIFEEFVQLRDAATGGTGLGLFISRRLAELLGGTLHVESAPGHGSTFVVTLPLDA